MLKNWTQTICAVVTLALLCGSMLVYAVLSIYGVINSSANAQRDALNALAVSNRQAVANLAEQFQTSQMQMMQRMTKVEERQNFDDKQIAQTNNSINRLTDGLSELTKELSNLEGVIADGRGRK